MLNKTRAVKTMAAAAALIAGLGLGAVLGLPGVAQAQEDTTTTVVEDSTEATTATTVADDAADDTTTPETDRPARGDENCDHVGEESDTSTT